jgi:hypothetical protein
MKRIDFSKALEANVSRVITVPFPRKSIAANPTCAYALFAEMGRVSGPPMYRHATNAGARG